MTKEEYNNKVEDTARAVLTECNAKGWKHENDGGSFFDFYQDAEYDGSATSTIDAAFWAHSVSDAVALIAATDRDPDEVDPGLYEGAKWARATVVVAFCLFQLDVEGRMAEMFDDDCFEEALVAYPDSEKQRGYFPNNRRVTIPDGPWVVAAGNFVKIYLHKQNFSVVFEGEYETRGTRRKRYVVDCKRVYNQTESSIEDDLRRCHDEFGVVIADE